MFVSWCEINEFGNSWINSFKTHCIKTNDCLKYNASLCHDRLNTYLTWSRHNSYLTFDESWTRLLETAWDLSIGRRLWIICLSSSISFKSLVAGTCGWTLLIVSTALTSREIEISHEWEKKVHMILKWDSLSLRLGNNAFRLWSSFSQLENWNFFENGIWNLGSCCVTLRLTLLHNRSQLSAPSRSLKLLKCCAINEELY